MFIANLQQMDIANILRYLTIKKYVRTNEQTKSPKFEHKQSKW
jgi:uncharacterized protein YceH (UPF0502 family)